MSIRNFSQTLQNESGQLDLVARDEGTSNIFYRTRTLRFEPQGCIEYGPGSREVTINTAFNTGGSIIVPGDILWEPGTGTASIRAKNAGAHITAGGTNAVSHGLNNKADGEQSYTGGGFSNNVFSTSDNSVILGGSGNTIGLPLAGHDNSVVLGGTNLITAASDTVYACNNLEVGNRSTPTTGSIVRISQTLTNSWEDGNCGNSQYIYFTPNDFYGDNSTRFAITSNSTNGPSGWYANPASSTAAPMASKLIPKGFKIPETENTEFVAYRVTGIGTMPDVSVKLFQHFISGTPSVVDIADQAIAVADWTLGATTVLDTNANGTVSDGSLMVCVAFYDSSVNWPSVERLIGVRVPIERG